jgi:glutathione S-transferase
MSALKLYHWESSPDSRRMRMFLAEKRVDIPFVPVNLGEGEQRSDWYTAINPHHVVPSLALGDGAAVGEVPAIMRHVEETFPVPA